MNSQELKRCTKCGGEFPATVEFFAPRGKGRLNGQCKICITEYMKVYKLKNKKQLDRKRKIYYKKNKEQIDKKKKIYNERHRKLLAKRAKIYRKKNKELIAKQRKIHYEENKKLINKQRKIHYGENKELLTEQKRNYYKKNKKQCNKRCKIYREKNKRLISKRMKGYLKGKVRYKNTAFQGLIWFNKVRKNSKGYGEVTCAYCGKWTVPTCAEAKHHTEALNNIENNQMNRIYCSESCKMACPTYNQKFYPRGHKPASSREVNPLIRQMCFEHDNYECQKCGATQEDEQLHCHHVQGAAKEPLLANDIDNVITLCKTCHKWVHAQIDCGYADYRRPKCVEA